MKPSRFRKRSWRFYRNWTLFILMWLALFLLAIWMWRTSLPVYVYVLVAVPVYFICYCIYYPFYTTHPRVNLRLHNLTPGDAGLAHERVQFPSRDGLTLFGWYVPGRRRAAVILVHGGGSRGMSMIYHTSALALHDYGVLLFDLRAHGSSDGDTSTAGWRETQDLLGAVDYVQGRADVDADKVGVLGISLGGQITLRAAAQSRAIRAVVAEGPNAATLDDRGGRPTVVWRWISYAFYWLYYSMLSFMNGEKPPAGVLATIQDIAPQPLLLISTGKGKEQAFTRLLYEAAQEPKELWELPEARHGGGYFFDKEEYAARIAAFFGAALLDEGTTGPKPLSQSQEAS